MHSIQDGPVPIGHSHRGSFGAVFPEAAASLGLVQTVQGVAELT